MNVRFNTLLDGLAALRRGLKHWAVRAILVAAIIAALFWKLEPSQLKDMLRGFDPRVGLLMLGVNLSLSVLFAWRWQGIAASLGLDAPFRAFARATWVSQSISELGPALVIGEMARFQLLRGHGDAWRLVTSQAIDRFSGNIVLLMLVAALTPLYLDWLDAFPGRSIALLILLLIGGLSLAVIVARRFWTTAYPHPHEIMALCDPRNAPRHYVVSALIQLLLAANLALAALGLGIANAEAARVFLLAPLILLGIGLLPGLVSDWGKREAVAIALLAPAGLTAEQSFAASLIYGVVHLLSVMPATLWLWTRPTHTTHGVP